MKANLAASIIALAISSSAGAQHASAVASSGTIPNEVRRRIAQAIWPENLFDSTGAPERDFIRRPFRPTFADLRIRRVSALPTLPAVELYVGSAYSSGCFDCRTWTYAVAQHGTQFLTMLGPDDIGYLAPWVPQKVLSDSTRLRGFVIDVLGATCLLGCEVKQVHRRAEIPDVDSPFLRAADGENTTWQMPRTYSWQRNGGVLLEFALFGAGSGVYTVRAEWNGTDRLNVSVSPVARYIYP